MLPAILILMVALMTMAAGAAEPVRVTDPKDKAIVDGFLIQVSKVPEQLSSERCKELAADDAEETEAIMWRAMPYLRMPLVAYRITGDAKHLDIFVEAFENLRSALTTGPDGFLGWYGKVDPDYADPQEPGVRLDSVISSFSAAEAVSDFVCLVDADPALSSRYTKQRSEYLDLVENHLVRKHDVRGDYVDLGEGGAVYRTPLSGLKKDYCARLTMPHNKHAIIIRGLLALYRATGKGEYMQRAIKLGTRYKRSLTLKNGHYEWNYWDPAGAWDVNPQDPSRWKHWFGPEHRGGYYSSSLSQAVLLHQYGLVFDATDMDRFVRTQLEMCWNGDPVHPQWSRVDGTRPPEYTQGEYIASSLAVFSDKIAQYLFTGTRQDAQLRQAGDDWAGGPGAAGWLTAKLLHYPAGKGGKQIFADFGKRFLEKGQNQDFVKSLRFEVAPPGFSSPMTPAEVHDMPQEPKSP